MCIYCSPFRNAEKNVATRMFLVKKRALDLLGNTLFNSDANDISKYGKQELSSCVTRDWERFTC